MKTTNLDHPIRNTLARLALASTMGAAMFFGASPASAEPPVTAGLKLYLDASLLTDLSDGATVTTWTDMSGNGNNATAAGTPIYKTGALNGEPVIRFNNPQWANNASFTTANLSSQFPTAATLFIVATIDDNSYTLVDTNANTDTDEWWSWHGDSKSAPAVFRSSRLDRYCDMPQGSNVFAISSSASAWEMSINGTSQGVASGQYNAGGPMIIGNCSNGRSFNGDIAEILIYDSVLTPTEANQVGSYLAQKYALTTAYPPLPLAVKLTSPANALVIPSGTSVTASATVSDPGAFTHTVTFHVTPTSPPGATFTMDSTDTSSPYTADLGALANGTYNIYATVLNSNAETATSATRTFTVASPVPTTITLDSPAPPSTYGDAVTFTTTISPIPTGGMVQFLDGGLPLGSAVPVNGSGVATISTTTLSAGDHEITAEYIGFQIYETSSTAASVSQVVQKATLTVTAQNVVRFVDTANPSFTYQITGFQNGQSLANSGVTGAPDLSTTAVLESPLGDYPITCAVGDLAADNYSFTSFVDGTLTVVIPRNVWNVKFGNLNLGNFAGAAIENATPNSLWNSITTPTPSNQALSYATGDPSTATLTVTAAMPITLADYAAVSGIQLFSRWIKMNSNSGIPFTMTVGGLSASATYDLIVYSDWFWNDGDAFPVTQTAGTGLTGTVYLDQITTDPHGAVPALVQDTDPLANTSVQGNWIRITGLIPDASGNLAFSMGGTNSGFNGFQLIEMSSGGGSGFVNWAAANAGGQSAGEDFDNNGVENGIEYFMGESGSTFTAMPGLNGSNTITWPMDTAYSGTYEVQTSPDLVNWTNVDPRPMPSGGTLSYTLPTGAAGGKSFARLLVTPTP